MRYKSILILLTLFLTGCIEDDLTIQDSPIVEKKASTKEKLQINCDQLNVIEKKKPFYKEKKLYKPVTGKYKKNGSGITSISVGDFNVIGGRLILSSQVKKIISFDSNKIPAGQNFTHNKIYKKINNRFSSIITEHKNNDIYGVCAYKTQSKIKGDNEADFIKKRERYVGVIETLTKIEKE